MNAPHQIKVIQNNALVLRIVVKQLLWTHVMELQHAKIFALLVAMGQELVLIKIKNVVLIKINNIIKNKYDLKK